MRKRIREWKDRLKKYRLSLEERYPMIARRTTRLYGHKFDLRHPRVADGVRQALLKRTYEKPEVEMIQRYLVPSDRVVEIGTGIGATALVISDIVGSDHIVSFEADPRTIELAQRNFELNAKPIVIEHAALWSGPNRPETLEFSCNTNLSSSSLIRRSGTEFVVAIPTRDLEETLKHYSASALVLDIEGGEIDLLGHHSNLAGVRKILMETHARIVGDAANSEMLDCLRQIGFHVVESVRDGRFLALERESPGH
ncbi:MAG TPA: FkbM family methyltransferase [Dehalococcoidia bacterium]|nr:FkbM family methyltransferase [Dehalococcoidia bacterium]